MNALRYLDIFLIVVTAPVLVLLGMRVGAGRRLQPLGSPRPV